VRAGVVVVGGEAAELGLELFLGSGGVLPGEELFQGLVEAPGLAAGLRVVGPECLEAILRLSSSSSKAPAVQCWCYAPPANLTGQAAAGRVRASSALFLVRGELHRRDRTSLRRLPAMPGD
jgi:hypothetical protein